MKLDKFLCFMFLSVFLSLTLYKQNTPFFENITNQILRLNYTQLICKPVRSKNKRLCRVSVSSTSIEKHYYFLTFLFYFKRIFIIVGDNIVLAFEGFKVS